MTHQDLVGRSVTRKASDYTGGRTGIVLQVDDSKNRAQVNWQHECDGSLVNGRIKGLKTWVALSQLLITSSVS